MREMKKNSKAKVEAERAAQREFAQAVGEVQAPVEDLPSPDAREEAPKLPEEANLNLVFARLFGRSK